MSSGNYLSKYIDYQVEIVSVLRLVSYVADSHTMHDEAFRCSETDGDYGNNVN